MAGPARWGILGGILAAAVLYGAAVAYAGGGGDGEGGGVLLTTDNPQMQVEARAAPEGAAAVLQVRIGAIQNPSLTPFGIVVRLADGQEIGRFAIFPADRTGDYFLSLKPAEREALAAGGGALLLSIDRIGETAAPLSVTVDFVRAK